MLQRGNADGGRQGNRRRTRQLRRSFSVSILVGNDVEAPVLEDAYHTMISQEDSAAIPQDSQAKGVEKYHPEKNIAAAKMKEIKDAYQTMNNKSLRTEKTSDMNNPVEIKLEATETQDAVVGEAAAINAKYAAEEPKSAVDVQEFTELATDQLQPIEVALDEIVDAAEGPKEERVEAKSVKTKSNEMEDAGGTHTAVVEVVESAADQALCPPKIGDEEAVAATVEMEASDEETTVSDDMKEDLSAKSAKLASTESEIVVAEVNDDVKAVSDFSNVKVSTDKKGASNEGLAAFASDGVPVDVRLPVDTCEGVASVVETDAIKAVAEEEDTETTTSEAIEIVSPDEPKPVTPVRGMSVEAVAEAVADSKTGDEACLTELEVKPESDIEKETAEVGKHEAVFVDEEVEEATVVQEQEVADKEIEASDVEADIAVESSVTTDTTCNDDTPAYRISETIVKKVKAEEVSVVEINGAARKETETETSPINEDAKVVEEAKTDVVLFGERTEVVVSELETVASASAEIDEAVVEETASCTEIAEVAVEEAKTEIVPVAETKGEVQFEKSDNVEVEAVENDFVAEKVEDTEQSIDKMSKEAPAVAAVDTAPAITKVSDEATSVQQTPALKADSADDTPAGVNLTVSTISEYEENESSKSSDSFEVDTKPIRAVSTLIGRFEHIAKHNATEAASSRTSSRTSSRVSSPLPSPPSSWSRGKGSETVVKSNKAIESFEGPAHVEPNNEDVLTEAEVDQEAAEVDKTAEVAESVDASSGFEETPAENDVNEEATTLNDAKTVACENILVATDVGGVAKGSSEAEAPAVAVDAEESTLEAEAATKASDAIKEIPVAEVTVVEQESIDESTEAEVELEKTPAVETELAEIIAEPEAEDVDLESLSEEETAMTAKEADAIASEATEAYGAVEKVPVAVQTAVDMAEADVEASEPETILAAYKPAEASILSVDGPEVNAAWNEAVEDVQEDAEDAAPSATSLGDVAEAVDDFTTSESVDDFAPVANQNEEDSSEFVSAMKETQAMYEEITEPQVEGGKQEAMSESMERPLTSPPAPGVRPDNGVLAYEGTTKASVVTAPSNEATKTATDDAKEKTPERNSLQIPYEQPTYEILGVTRANNVIMYHIYAINNAAGEQAMSIPKRYSEFKVLDEQLRALDVPSVHDLPVLPKPGVVSFLRGRRSQKTIEMREKAFGDFLHYVRKHEDLHKSTIFQQFIAN